MRSSHGPRLASEPPRDPLDRLTLPAPRSRPVGGDPLGQPDPVDHAEGTVLDIALRCRTTAARRYRPRRRMDARSRGHVAGRSTRPRSRRAPSSRPPPRRCRSRRPITRSIHGGRDRDRHLRDSEASIEVDSGVYPLAARAADRRIDRSRRLNDRRDPHRARRLRVRVAASPGGRSSLPRSPSDPTAG